MSVWMYRGARVTVPPAADIPFSFQPGRPGAAVVQRALDAVVPWHRGEDPIETIEMVSDRMLPIVVPIEGRIPMWGIHTGHTARRPQQSPFVQVDISKLDRTNLFTVELARTPQQPVLTRAYPGEYIPPLPWMGSAQSADGGPKACLEFWRTHAYVFRKKLMSRRLPKPDWFVTV